MSDRFADPRVCPNCRTPRTDQERCWNCQVWLTSGEAVELVERLGEYDTVLAAMRRRRETETGHVGWPAPISVEGRSHYADPSVCPACRNRISRTRECTECGLDVSGRDGAELWRILNRIDVLLASLRAEAMTIMPAADEWPAGAVIVDPEPPQPRFAPGTFHRAPEPQAQPRPERPPRPVPEPEPRPEPPPHPTPDVVPEPEPQPEPAPHPTPELVPEPAPEPIGAPMASVTPSTPRRFDVGSALLALGALCVVIAGFIFISVSWDSMGLTGRTLTLSGVTAVVAGFAVFATFRRLRATAEALWWVFLGLLTFDYVAASIAELAGLGALTDQTRWLVYGLLMVTVATALAVWTRTALQATIWATRVFMVASVGVIATGFDLPGHPVWMILAGTAASALVVIVFAGLGFGWTAIVAAVIPLVMLAAAQFAVIGLVTARPRFADIWTGEGGAATLTLVLSVVAAGLVVRRLKDRYRAEVAVGVSTLVVAVVTFNVLLVLLVPLVDSGYIEVSQFVAVLAALVLTLLGLVLPGDWGQGSRFAAVGSWFVTAVIALWWTIEFFAVTTGAETDGARSRWLTPTAPQSETYESTALSAAGFLIAAAIPLVAARWEAWFPRDGAYLGLSRWIPAWVAVTVPVSVAMALAFSGAPVIAVASVLIVSAGAATLILERDVASTLTAVIVLSSVGALTTVAVQEVAGATLLGAAAVLGLLGLRSRGRERRSAVWLLGVIAGLAGAIALLAAYAVDPALQALIVMSVGASVVALGQAFVGTRSRYAWEIVAAGLAIIALAAMAPEPLEWQSANWALFAAGLTAAGLLADDRRWMKWASLVPWSISYVLLMGVFDIGVIEVYTVPLGLVLLGVGWAAWRLRPRQNSMVTLGPGIAVALVPSAWLAVEEITSVRALCVLLAALALLAAGVQRNWLAPFAFGAITAAVLVVVSVGPYANAVPRWAVIGGAGAILLGVGATFEARVRNAKVAIRYLVDMR